MRGVILLAAVSAVALAKPGTYRESEDFQYERSATGEGTKAGFYGAQRGNVGGNYERAHNMDGLAQKQLGDAVRNVQGELRDTNHIGRGNVYTAANTRGAYDQKYLNTGNLEGRNLQEGSSLVSNSQTSGRKFSSRNAAHSSSPNTEQYPSDNPDYRIGYSSYQQNAQTNAFGSEGSRKTLQSANHEASNRQRGYNVRDQERESLAYTGSEYKGQGAYDYSHRSRSESQRQEQSAYGSNSETSVVGGAQRTENAYGSTAQTRLNGGGPVRISIRPGSTITIPVRAEKVDDNHRGFDANTINTDAEKLGAGQYTNSKNYESSYRYNKAWEKHDNNPAAVPLAIPTNRPYPEIYATGSHDTNAATAQHGRGDAKTRYSGYDGASGSQSRYDSGYNAQDHQRSYGTHSNAYKNSQNILGTNGAVTNVDVGTQDSMPKNYQSKYSYQKSWDRQGDPYVILPASGVNADGQSQSLFNSQHQGYRSQNYNSHASHAGYTKTGQVEECDEHDHLRMRRSNPIENRQQVDPYHQNHQYEGQVLEQQQQVELEDLGQEILTQHDFDNLESFSHQSEDKWGKPDKLQKPSSDAHIQSVQPGKLEDLDQQQQVQTSWDNFEQQVENKWDNLKNLAQQTQKLEEFGQKLENQWSNSENSSHHNGLHTLDTGSGSNMESLSHKSENNWGQRDKLQKPSPGSQTLSIQQDKLEELDQQQQVQTSWDNLGQEVENKWDNLENLGQQTQKLDHFGQHLENQWSNSENSGYHHGLHTLHTGSGSNMESLSHQSENKRGQPDKLQKPSPGAQILSIQPSKLQDLDQQQQVQTSWDNLGQQTQNLENFGQHTENQRSNSENSGYHHGLHTYTLHTGSGRNLESFSHQSENKWGKQDKLQKPSPGAQPLSIQPDNLDDLDQQQQVQTSWDNLGQQVENKWDNLAKVGQQTQKLENFGQQGENQWSNSENLGQQTQDLDNLGQQTVNFDTIRTEGHPNGWHTLHTGSGNQWKWKSTVDSDVSDSHVIENNNEGLINPGRDTGSSSNRGGSLQSLWDKIDNMEQMTIPSDSNHKHNSTSGNHNQYSNGLLNGFQSSQNTQGSNNDQMSHGGTYHYRQSSHSWKLHSGTTEKSYSHYETSDYQPWHSTGENTTEKIRFDVRTTGEVKPSDAGRGDIGAEDSETLVESKAPLIFTSQTKPREAKSIEGLSLTQENINHNSHKAEDKEEKYNTQSLGVLSLEEQGRHEQTNLDEARTSSSNINISHNQRERTESSHHAYSSANNQQDQRQVQTSWSQHGNGQWQEQNTGQQLEDLGQQVETDWFKHTTQPEVNETHSGHHYTQQTHHAGGNLENLGQQVITDWTNLEPQSQHAQNMQQTTNSRESLADYGQQRETGWKPAESLGHQSRQASQTGYIHHQTQSTPKSIHTGENLEDMGQQVQTDWTQDENLQQQSQLTQQTSDLDSLTQQGSDDFYKQRYHEKPQERSQLNIEQAVPAKVEEVTTQKPGFWKKVSTKVNGWFGKS